MLKPIKNNKEYSKIIDELESLDLDVPYEKQRHDMLLELLNDYENNMDDDLSHSVSFIGSDICITSTSNDLCSHEPKTITERMREIDCDVDLIDLKRKTNANVLEFASKSARIQRDSNNKVTINMSDGQTIVINARDKIYIET